LNGEPDLPNAVALAALFCLLGNPLELFDAGFSDVICYRYYGWWRSCLGWNHYTTDREGIT